VEKNNRIIWLSDREAQSISRVGSKAANLAKLYQAGYPVPPGFCITTDAFQDVLTIQNSDESRVEEGSLHTEALNRIDIMLTDSILREEIYSSCEKLKKQCQQDIKVAVRSSSTLEDLSGASFAGQFTSILNVNTGEQLLAAIRECWLSAYSARAQAYHVRSGFKEVPSRMAVLVQEMIPPEMAGVLFTVHPFNISSDRMLIEATPGLGDGVVAGIKTGIQFSADRKTFKLLDGSGASHDGTELCHKADWGQLLKEALKIEELFGVPQDIEWAFRKGRFYILQSRPITGMSRQQNREIWTRANAGEIMPNVVTPLTWSIFRYVLNRAGIYRAKSPVTLHWRWTHPTGRWPDSPRLFRGRAYMELGIVYMGFGCMPGITPEILERMLGFEFHLCGKEEIPARRPRWHVMDVYRGVRFWAEMLGITRCLAWQAGKWAKMSRRTDEAQNSGGHHEDITKSIEKLLQETSKILGLHIQCTAMAFSAFGLLDRVLKKYLEAEKVQVFESRLVADFKAMGTVQQNLAIWELAQAAKNLPSVFNAISNGKSVEEMTDFQGSRTEAAQFLTLWQSFISRFGNRGTEEFELAAPHWDDDPSFVFNRIEEILRNQIPNPQEMLTLRHDIGGKEKREVCEHIRLKGGKTAAWLFKRLINSYREFVPLRENLKYHVVSRFNMLRKHFISIGKDLEGSGQVQDHQDIFFLKYDEIRGLLSPQSSTIFDTKAIIQNRKKENKKNSEFTAPDFWISIDGKDEPVDLTVTGRALTADPDRPGKGGVREMNRLQ